jgi:predicted ATPase
VDSGLSAKAYLACCLWMLGYPNQAQAQSQEVLELAHKLNHSFTLADVLRYGGCEFSKMLGDGQALKHHAEELIQLSQEKHFPAWLPDGKSALGEALIMLGQFQKGKALVLEEIGEKLRRDVRSFTTRSYLTLAGGYLKHGDLAQGLSILNEVFDLMEQMDERYLEAEGQRMLAAFQLFQGDQRAAEASLQQALAVARRQQARSLELRAAIDLAHLWRKQGKTDEACQMISELYAWFTEGFDTPDLKRARGLLSETATDQATNPSKPPPGRLPLPGRRPPPAAPLDE